jgi:type II secretory pathway component PulF
MDTLLVSWPTLIVLGIGLRMSLRLHYGARGPEANDPVYNFVAIISWVLIVLGLVPAVLFTAFTLFGLMVLVLAGFTLVEVVTQSRAAQRRSVCSMLTMFLQRKLHFDAAFMLSPQSVRGRVGRAAKRLFADLNAGVPLAVAAQAHRNALPQEAVAYIAAGDTLRCEAAALKELSEIDDGELILLWRACIDRISYLLCVLVVMFAVLAFVMIKIIPAYQQIFEEFEMELPALTQLAISFSTDFLAYLAVPSLLVLLFVLTSALMIGVFQLFDVNILRWISDHMFGGNSDADVLRILAVAAEQRQPFIGVFDRLASVYPSSMTRQRLSNVARAVGAGNPWPSALERTSVVSGAEAALLRSAEPTGSLPWALREIATRRQKRIIYRMTIALQVLYPVIIVMLGGLVGFYVVSLFLPIVKLIESLV